jgi:hypothetical protein
MWHDRSEAWECHPEVARAVGHKAKADGTFWYVHRDCAPHHTHARRA